MAALAALAGRVAWVVRTDPGHSTGQAIRQQRRIIFQPGRPGSIMARARRSYVMLAGSRQVPSCYVDPALIGDEQLADISLRVGRALAMDPLAVQDTILSRRRRRFVYLKRHITSQEADAVANLRLAAVKITYEWRRQYPCGDLASSVIGFRYRDGTAGGGLEMSLRRYLDARGGKRSVLADARRRPIWLEPQRSSLPRDGSNVMLCIDAVVQGYLQQAVAAAVSDFGAKWGTGVVVDPATGEIMAMCSAPGFEPENFAAVPAERRLARAVSVPYEPGSVMKPIFAAAAVDSGRLTFDTVIDCENGSYRASGGGRIRDHRRYGRMSLTDVVVHSSNIGMAKVGEALGNARLYETARRFGFGGRSGIEVPGESAGIIRPLARWDGYSMRRVPFGQEMSVTAVQLAMAFSALVNGGELLRPRLIDQVRSPAGRVILRGRRQVVRRVLSPETARQTLAVLAQVVQRGTGKASRLDMWTSFGKTGTAQIPGRGGYVDGAYAGTFVGGAPAKGPRALCVITVYWPDRAKGYYGGKVAAPYVRRVLRKTLTYLDVPPDRAGDVAMRY